ALKILPPEVRSDPGRHRRFEEEARAASALNHPNIVTVYDIGASGPAFFIAMELVRGKTLRELIADGPLPVRRLITLGSQIAEGLSTAHEAGIVHRDLKPENVMVTKEGLVKILDFGLAKRTPARAANASSAGTEVQGTEPGARPLHGAGARRGSRAAVGDPAPGGAAPTAHRLHRPAAGASVDRGTAARAGLLSRHADGSRRHRQDAPRAGGRAGARAGVFR